MTTFENKCKHFNGTGKGRCTAGVLYADVRNNNGSFMERSVWPCFKDSNSPVSCELREWSTQAEIDNHNKKIIAAMNAIRSVRPKIKEAIAERGMTDQNTTGCIPCPVCESGEVRFSYAGAYNGHISAKCSNGCVNWME